MLFLDKWERKFGWLSFPGLLRYYALFHVMVYLLQILNPAIGAQLDLDRDKIMSGEVWRVVTFLFAPSGYGGQQAFGALFLFCMVSISFLCSDGLEQAWGVFRASLFHYAGILCILALNLFVTLPGLGSLPYMTAFFAFATLYPRVELNLMFVLPVQVRWIALGWLAYFLYNFLRFPLLLVLLPLYLPLFGNYLLWAGIPALRGQARVVKSGARKRKFDKHKPNQGEAFHRCKACGRTEISDPELEFRMAADGEEYCGDHLPQ